MTPEFFVYQTKRYRVEGERIFIQCGEIAGLSRYKELTHGGKRYVAVMSAYQAAKGA